MLLKNVLRSIKNKPLRLVGIILLVLMASTLYVSLSYSISSLEQQLDTYVKEQNQEDFTFEMNPYLTTSELTEYNIDQSTTQVLELTYLDQKGIINKSEVFSNRINKLKQQHNIEIEKRLYKQFDFESEPLDKKVTIRVFKNATKINKTYIQEGSMPINNQEIALSKVFAEQNGIKLHDSITLNNQEYKIVGYVMFPDYIYPQLSEQSLVFNPSNQVLATMTDEAYNNLNVIESSHYTGIFKEDHKTEIEQLNKEYIVNLIDDKTAFKTGAIYGEIEGNKQMTNAMAGVILILAVIVIGIIVNKSINSEAKQIGVIKSLGYTNIEVMRSYMIYPLIAGLLGSVLGYLLGYIGSSPLSQAYELFYQLPVDEAVHSFDIIIGGTLIPFLSLNVFSLIVIYLIVKKRPLELIKPKSNNKTNKIAKGITRVLKRAKFETRFKYSLALRGTGKLLVSFIGVMIASIYLVFAVMGIGSFDDVIYEAFGDSSYNYQVNYRYPINQVTNESRDLYTMVPSKIKKVNETETDENITLFGVEQNLNLTSIKNQQDESLIDDLYKNKENAVITKMLAIIVGIEIGDTISFETLSGSVKEVIVVGISGNYSYPYIYMQKGTVNEYLGLEDSYYNGLYSKDKVKDDDSIATIFNKTELIESLEELMGIAKMSIYAIIAVAIVIGLIVLILIANFTIEDHFKTISFLKVMGYNKKEVSNMVVNIYLPIVIIAYIIAIPLTIMGFNALMAEIAKEMNYVIPLNISFIQAVMGLFIIVMTYYVSLIIAKRKLNKISLQESLKIEE
ncbi:ABC transporter permease [Haloplasma contractile]|uniref:MacB-like periplasmic core domain protein n=1 Tax=Haloplasma contractile SSD-17B TaxID=1033810 RepID=U2EBQ2_9MOLU|nr:FtsX-like permease family protein [Haloplasma contractile]ERJ12493.1 MacB-like periplasmic core domain protein [Haloplasma contractile SSD-17B]